MRILFLFTLFTLISSDFLFSQENSTIIQTINDRELKIYKGNNKINIFFEYCDASNLENCYTSTIKFDLRGIVKLLEENKKFGKLEIQENGTLIYKEDGTISIISLAGIKSDFIDSNILKNAVRDVFF